MFGLHLCTRAPCGVCNGVWTITDTNENLQSLFKKQLLKAGLFSLPNGRRNNKKKKRGKKKLHKVFNKKMSQELIYLNKKAG